MDINSVFKFLRNDIHSVVFATINEFGLPETRVIDVMLYDKNGLYFITARGKNFYKQLINNKNISLTGFKGNSTISSIAVSVQGNVKDIGSELLNEVFEKNPYMNTIYPTIESKTALTVFQIYKGTGEYFNLSKHPIERYSFSFGDAKLTWHGYYINEKCIHCFRCLSVCPQSCIDINEKSAYIRQENCLHCGNCMDVCPANAIERR